MNLSRALVWGAQAAGLLVSAAPPKHSFPKVRDGEPPSPAREPRALPGN
jgi:hypothetical protein